MKVKFSKGLRKHGDDDDKNNRIGPTKNIVAIFLPSVKYFSKYQLYDKKFANWRGDMRWLA
jgi:hypothetical protein